MKILLAEDEKVIGTVLTTCLRAMFATVAGFELIEAKTLAEAKDECISHDPHIVLMDLTFQDASAKATIAEIDFFALRADVCIISSDSSSETREACFRGGAMAYFDKMQLLDRSIDGQFTIMRMAGRFVDSYYRCLYHVRDGKG